MRKIVYGIICFLLLAFATQWAVIKYFPDLVYKIATHRTGNRFNTWINAGETNASMRKVVMPNPDFVYSALFYDITDHPITVSGVFPDSTYASVSFYDDRCQPYQVYNNLDPNRKGKFEFILDSKEANAPHSMKAKTNRGVIICRFLRSNDSSYRQLVSYQKTLSCTLR